eukprot:TRINITY_DN4564_c0_g1_i1.p1 TRINITY_DN4564_c0_g1~~TRINITY_DN4564_c0_g1_i1.p1  ORF type:complete len:226 (+),score=48.59 TRINITY_DN4564_c0_g1_i1:99-776(+)
MASKDFEEEDSSIQISDKELSNIYSRLLIDANSSPNAAKNVTSNLESIISKIRLKEQKGAFNERQLLCKARFVLAKNAPSEVRLDSFKNGALYKKLCRQILENKRADDKIDHLSKVRIRDSALKRKELERCKYSPRSIKNSHTYGKRAISILKENYIPIFVKNQSFLLSRAPRLSLSKQELNNSSPSSRLLPNSLAESNVVCEVRVVGDESSLEYKLACSSEWRY